MVKVDPGCARMDDLEKVRLEYREMSSPHTRTDRYILLQVLYDMVDHQQQLSHQQPLRSQLLRRLLIIHTGSFSRPLASAQSPATFLPHIQNG